MVKCARPSNCTKTNKNTKKAMQCYKIPSKRSYENMVFFSYKKGNRGNKRSKAIEVLSTILWGVTSKECLPILKDFAEWYVYHY